MLTFSNSSNRCWFISAIQAVLHIPPLANLLRDDMMNKIVVRKRKNSSDFAMELSRIAREYWHTFTYEKTVDLDALFDIFVKINRNFGGKKPYDAAEAFLAILDTLDTAFISKPPQCLHLECNVDAWNEHVDKTKSSFLSDAIMGQVRRVYKGDVAYEHFWGITVRKHSVSSGIEDYLNDQDTGITRTFTHLPLILPIIFQKSADKHFIHYDLDMAFGGACYSLFAVLLHNSSHWVAMCANAGVWHLLDDTRCSTIFDMNTLIQKDAMLLLYKQVEPNLQTKQSSA